jgi:hypothetical protein
MVDIPGNPIEARRELSSKVSGLKEESWSEDWPWVEVGSDMLTANSDLDSVGLALSNQVTKKQRICIHILS